MPTSWSAERACNEPSSSRAATATVSRPSACAARKTRRAISPRLATSTFFMVRLVSWRDDTDGRTPPGAEEHGERDEARDREGRVRDGVAHGVRQRTSACGAEGLAGRPRKADQGERVAVVETDLLGDVRQERHR